MFNNQLCGRLVTMDGLMGGTCTLTSRSLIGSLVQLSGKYFPEIELNEASRYEPVGTWHRHFFSFRLCTLGTVDQQMHSFLGLSMDVRLDFCPFLILYYSNSHVHLFATNSADEYHSPRFSLVYPVLS